MTRWHYRGDIDLRHGGDFYDLSDWQYGYVAAVRVTDLDSAAGYDGASLIERVSIPLPDKRDASDSIWLKSALDICGYTSDGKTISNNYATYSLKTVAGKLLLLDALTAYGRYDTESSEIVAIGPDAPDSFQGWTLDTRLRANAKLRNYVRNHHLKG